MVETSERLAVVRVLRKKRYSENFLKIHKKTGVGVFLWILQNFKNTYFVEHLGTVASQRLHD